ncbi:lysine-specific demethylase JMJ30 [Physcomitrium patens]|uniref:DM8 domain-containing protein n=1 Tax=Physcomitrium patens TaxID=3218 RepID=A0A2K1L0K0_PHYPA|nr:lysine-specific demethylase JMJ30-like [Physcomitrium patens]PNR59554.1 hypothetical protein PHYPA_002345 [Physcomitrium patens]|eukprot:XP_024402842.1 lysine-specific demethylase JMJ30-like [Physcomitrella patens]
MPSVARTQVLEFLKQVRNEGGVVFAGLSEKAWCGTDEKAAEAAYELAWEELHGGPWQSVSLVWRDAFSLSCLSLASCHHHANRPAEALKVLDLGLIIGGPQFRAELDAALHSIGSTNGLEASNGTEGLPSMQDLHLRTKNEGQKLKEVNNMSL